jgi:hypothetical protein
VSEALSIKNGDDIPASGAVEMLGVDSFGAHSGTVAAIETSPASSSGFVPPFLLVSYFSPG